jgi:hypothetical protein
MPAHAVTQAGGVVECRRRAWVVHAQLGLANLQ